MSDSKLADYQQQSLSSRWYDPTLESLSESTRQLLETYSGIPPDQVIQHCQNVRDDGLKIWQFPCIGKFRFLHLFIGQHPLYHSEILPRMKTDRQVYLDLGCCFAQDIRRLVADGVDSSKCYGSDVSLGFIQLGYDLFRDKDKLQSKFIAANIFDESSALETLYGRVDIIGASSFFHLFSWNDQKTVAHRVVRLMKGEDSLLVGRQVGNSHPREYERRGGNGTRYLHNVESWQRMWKEVGEELGGLEFDVQGSIAPLEDSKDVKGDHDGAPEDSGRNRLIFSVKML